MKGIPVFIGKLTLRVFIAILVGILLLSAVYCIPAEAMEENVQSSAQFLYEEGLYPWLYPWCTSMVDNFTDTFMLLHAAYVNDESPVVQAMNVYRPHFGTKDMPYADLVSHYIEGKAYTDEITYERYWHGYLLYLKPLLCVTDYPGLRMVNAVAQVLVFAAVIWLMVRQELKRYIPAYVTTMLFLVPVVTVKCLQFSSCWFLMNGGILALLLNRRELEEKEGYIFLYLGIFTAFFDFLTYPIGVIGVVAAMYFAIRRSRGIWEDFCKLFKVCFCWGFGYAGMWAGKWVAGSLITGSNQLLGAMGKIQERTTGAETTVYGEVVENAVLKSLTENRNYFWDNPPAVMAMNLVVAAALVVFVWLILRKKTSWRAISWTVPFLLIAAMPIVWYVLTANHSIMHAWYTHKAMIAYAFGIMCAAVKLTEKQTG